MTPARPHLSVVVPVYNERATIREILRRIEEVPVDKEIVLIDDASTDGTRAELEAIVKDRPDGRVRLFLQEKNQGKGAAIRRGFAEARGEILLIQDADLEYDPADYPKILAPLERGEADVVYGSRFLDGSVRIRRPYRFANWVLTTWSNVLTRKSLTDVWTCYKAFPRSVLDRIVLTEDRFGIEPEMTAKFAKAKLRFAEVQVSYRPRTHAEGKKIGIGDAIHGMWTTLLHNVKG